MSSFDLGDFLCHLEEAIKIARDGCAQANIDSLSDYLIKNEGEDFYRFRTICLKIGDEIIDLLLYGLTPQGCLDLDKIDVEFDTIINANPKAVKNVEDKTGNPKFSITLSRGALAKHSKGQRVTIQAVNQISMDEFRRSILHTKRMVKIIATICLYLP